MTRGEAHKAKELKGFAQAIQMNNGDYRVVMQDTRSTMGIRYFTDYVELLHWSGLSQE